MACSCERDPQQANDSAFAEYIERSEDEQGRIMRPQRAREYEQDTQARMAELVDAQDSKSCDRKVMRVRFSLRALRKLFTQETVRFGTAQTSLVPPSIR